MVLASQNTLLIVKAFVAYHSIMRTSLIYCLRELKSKPLAASWKLLLLLCAPIWLGSFLQFNAGFLITGYCHWMLKKQSNLYRAMWQYSLIPVPPRMTNNGTKCVFADLEWVHSTIHSCTRATVGLFIIYRKGVGPDFWNEPVAVGTIDFENGSVMCSCNHLTHLCYTPQFWCGPGT